MSHWVGVSKGLCEINWKNVTHLVRASAQPRSKISLKEALATFSDALALSVWEAETFVLWLPWKIWSGEVADDQLAKLELLCKLIARLPTTLSQHIWQVLPGKILLKWFQHCVPTFAKIQQSPLFNADFDLTEDDDDEIAALQTNYSPHPPHQASQGQGWKIETKLIVPFWAF